MLTQSAGPKGTALPFSPAVEMQHFIISMTEEMGIALSEKRALNK